MSKGLGLERVLNLLHIAEQKMKVEQNVKLKPLFLGFFGGTMVTEIHKVVS